MFSWINPNSDLGIERAMSPFQQLLVCVKSKNYMANFFLTKLLQAAGVV